MTDYTKATNEQLRTALDMADYDIQRYAKTNPDLASAAQRVKIQVRDELKARFSNGT